MSPEQCLDAREAGTGADIYALGVLLFELLTGAPPFTGQRGRGAPRPREPSATARLGASATCRPPSMRCCGGVWTSRPPGAFPRPDVLAAFEAACHSRRVCEVSNRATSAPVSSGSGFGPWRCWASGPRARGCAAAAVDPHGGTLARVWSGVICRLSRVPAAEASLRTASLAARRVVEGAGHGRASSGRAGRAPGRATPAWPARPGVSRSWWPRRFGAGGCRVTPAATARLESGAPPARGPRASGGLSAITSASS